MIIIIIAVCTYCTTPPSGHSVIDLSNHILRRKRLALNSFFKVMLGKAGGEQSDGEETFIVIYFSRLNCSSTAWVAHCCTDATTGAIKPLLLTILLINGSEKASQPNQRSKG